MDFTHFSGEECSPKHQFEGKSVVDACMGIVVKTKVIQYMAEQCRDLKSFANRLSKALPAYIKSEVEALESRELIDDNVTMLYSEGLLDECQGAYWDVMGKFEDCEQG